VIALSRLVFCLVWFCFVFALFCFVLFCFVLFYFVLSCLVLSCLALLCLVLSCLVLSCTLPCFVDVIAHMNIVQTVVSGILNVELEAVLTLRSVLPCLCLLPLIFVCISIFSSRRVYVFSWLVVSCHDLLGVLLVRLKNRHR
jgi:hypothetical protein